MRYAVTALAALALPAAASAQNLVVNGDFSGGAAGFASDYAFTPASNTDEGQYTVRTDPFPWNPNFVSMGDHTTGTGNMLVVNGSETAGSVVYQSLPPIAIMTNTVYFFEAFVANVCCMPSYTGGNSPPMLTFSVSLDGGPLQTLDTLTIPLSPPGIFYGLGSSFNSGGATTATLFLINANTAFAGNDFAVDDIFLGTESTIPEPATWAMMIGGFGLVGGAMRRRARRVAYA